MPVDVTSPVGPPRATAWLSHGLEDLVGEEPSPAFDVVIVGSGYGGAVAAAELSGCAGADGKPLTICVLERGKEYLAGMFPARLADLAGHVRFATPDSPRQRGMHDGLYDLRWSSDAVAVVASGLGGGSLINAGVMLMPLPQVFHEARWPRAIQLDGTLFTLADGLLPFLGAKPLPARKSKTLALAALAGSHKFIDAPVTVAATAGANAAGVEMSQCLGCGDCATGCNHNAKESLDLNLLRLAQHAGARIVTGAVVLSVAPDESGTGWVLSVNHTDEHLRDRQPEPFQLRARRVILSAGTFGSTEILMRSRGRLVLSRQLGRKFSANGDMIAAVHEMTPAVNAVADERDDPETSRRPGGVEIGPTITAMIDLRTGVAETDLVIQDLAVPGPLRRLYEEATTTSDILNRLVDGDRSVHDGDPAGPDEAAVDERAIKRSLVVAMIGRDDAEGELSQGLGAPGPDADGMLTVSWPRLRLDPRFEVHHQRLEKLVTDSGAGGRVINNLLWRPLSEKLENVFGRNRGPLLTVHPLGGCAMGDDVSQGVTDEWGRVFRADAAPGETYDGLVVLDGSIVPTSLGINPSLTIAVLAQRAIRALKTVWGVTGDSALAKASSGGVAVVARPPFSTLATNAKPTPTEIVLTEQVCGLVPLRMRDGRVDHQVVEITLTTEPVAIDGLMRREAPTGRCLTIARASDGRSSRGQLRILRPAAECRAPEDNPVLLGAEVSGSLRVFTPQRSRPFWRTLRAAWAWLWNRGLRDITQHVVERVEESLAVRPRPAQPRQTWWQYLRDIWRLLSRAGAVRQIEYSLRIDRLLPGTVADAEIDGALFEGQPIRGVKHLTYSRSASPVTQLMELSLETFPQMARSGADTRLALNQRYLAAQGVPLLRIVRQENGVASLVDLLSFVLYAVRVVLQVHALSFRKPDPPPSREAELLPGAIPGLPIPQIEWLTLDGAATPPVRIRLARYDGRQTAGARAAVERPVVLIHGYSASGTTFAHRAVPGNLTETLCRAGRDVWVLDMRSSAGLDTATGVWPFELMAEQDIPIAVNHVRAATGETLVDVVAHCMGSAMFSMAVLALHAQPPGASTAAGNDTKAAPNMLHTRIGRVVLSQVGPVMVMSPANALRAYVMRYVRHFLPLEDYKFSPSNEEVSTASLLLDRALSATPMPAEEFRRENPIWPPGKVTPWVGTRHRMDALYARTFSLRNLSDEVLDRLDDFFGPLSVETASQVIHFAGFKTVTTCEGVNRFVVPRRLKERLIFPIMSIHGAENGLVDVETLALMRDTLTDAGVPYLNPANGGDPTKCAQSAEEIDAVIDANARVVGSRTASFLTWRIDKHGHQDCLIGKDAGSISGVIANFLGKPDV